MESSNVKNKSSGKRKMSSEDTRSYFAWNLEMERVLADVLRDQSNLANKGDGNWKAVAYSTVAQILSKYFGVHLMANNVKNHFKLRRTWYGIVSDILSQSGFDWDNTNYMITIENEIAWKEYVKRLVSHAVLEWHQIAYLLRLGALVRSLRVNILKGVFGINTCEQMLDKSSYICAFFSRSTADVCSLFKTISLLSQASPVPIRGRQAVVEIKRTTTRVIISSSQLLGISSTDLFIETQISGIQLIRLSVYLPMSHQHMNHYGVFEEELAEMLSADMQKEEGSTLIFVGVGSTKLTASWVHSYIGMTILPATQGFPRELSHSGSCGREKISCGDGDGDEKPPQLIRGRGRGLCSPSRRVPVSRKMDTPIDPSVNSIASLETQQVANDAQSNPVEEAKIFQI
ncbi:hypothetical protein JHK87_010334 [Glycine soja]|nr:hypothetical protein JHK87_010334 [Glycine soja]